MPAVGLGLLAISAAGSLILIASTSGRGLFGIAGAFLAVPVSAMLLSLLDIYGKRYELASELEALIRRAPDQWHLFQPNWPSDPGYGA